MASRRSSARPSGVKMRRYGVRRYDAAQLNATGMKLFACVALVLFSLYTTKQNPGAYT